MVFFNCNACGEALKKNAVEKHYMTKCKRCEVLSCVDCGKDFWGNDYQQHTKCISEEEKYSGKNYKPKPSANKGERKQEQWLEQVQAAVQKASGNNALTCILQKLADYPNIPRKQAKFENFLNNSLRVFNPSMTRQVWEAMAAAMSKELEPNPNRPTEASEQVSVNSDEADDESPKKKSKNRIHSNVDDATNSGYCQQPASAESNKQKNKRERKEERSKKATKKQKKDKNIVNTTNGDNEERSGKRKRSKHEDCYEENGLKKAKKDSAEEPEVQCAAEEQCETESEAVAALTPSKFKWESTIVRLLKLADDKELSVKKLKKKVLNEYFSQVGEKNRMTEEQIRAKFDKKMTKNARFKVHKERVKLIS